MGNKRNAQKISSLDRPVIAGIRWILKNWTSGRGLDSSGPAHSAEAVSSEHGNETAGSTAGWNFLTNYQLLKKDPDPRSQKNRVTECQMKMVKMSV